MQEIPDTGGGVAGFIAWLLWQVYQYFPSQGRDDWFLLFIFLAVVTRLLALPSSWKLAKWMTFLAIRREEGDIAKGYSVTFLHNLFTQTGVMFLFVWFFSTDAGHTFLVGRWSGGGSVLKIGDLASVEDYLGGLFCCGFFFLFLVGVVIDFVLPPRGSLGAETIPFYESVRPWTILLLCSFLHLLIVFASGLFYRYWSIASLVLMCVFTVVDWVALIGVVLWNALLLRNAKT